jgi:hypothetical protein
VQKEFDRSGVTQAELADRLNKGTDVVCRTLGAPGNWTLDTYSDYLWAISGAVVEYKLSYPLEKAVRNDTQPAWLADSDARVSSDYEGHLFPVAGGKSFKISSQATSGIAKVAA